MDGQCVGRVVLSIKDKSVGEAPVCLMPMEDLLGILNFSSSTRCFLKEVAHLSETSIRQLTIEYLTSALTKISRSLASNLSVERLSIGPMVGTDSGSDKESQSGDQKQTPVDKETVTDSREIPSEISAQSNVSEHIPSEMNVNLDYEDLSEVTPLEDEDTDRKPIILAPMAENETNQTTGLSPYPLDVVKNMSDTAEPSISDHDTLTKSTAAKKAFNSEAMGETPVESNNVQQISDVSGTGFAQNVIAPQTGGGIVPTIQFLPTFAINESANVTNTDQMNVKWIPVTFVNPEKPKDVPSKKSSDFRPDPPQIFMCNVCDKTFTLPHLFKRHQLIHTTVKRFKCEVCGKLHRTLSHLNTHLYKHKGGRARPFSCNICGKAFYQQNAVDNHQVVHTRVKSHMCEICGQGFTQIGNLIRHKVTHSEDKFLCKTCGKSFCRPQNLAEHERLHTGEVKHACDICDKEFTRKSTMITHKLVVHKGKKPFACDLCDKAYGQKSKLTNHRRSHTGETPFMCRICNKYYRLSRSLKYHMEKKHSKNQSTN